MIRHRSISIAVTAFAVFFLVFLGMRIALLEQHSKPKSRPRAVLKQLSKTPASSIKTDDQKHQPIHFVLIEAETPIVVQGLLALTSPPNNSHISLPETLNSRAPPFPLYLRCS